VAGGFDPLFENDDPQWGNVNMSTREDHPLNELLLFVRKLSSWGFTSLEPTETPYVESRCGCMGGQSIAVADINENLL